MLALCFAFSLLAQRRLSPFRAAQPTPPQAWIPSIRPGKNVTISLLTMGTGSEMWELFGHDAIWIHDNVTGRDTVFNWGVFNFRQSRFIPRFPQGHDAVRDGQRLLCRGS